MILWLCFYVLCFCLGLSLGGVVLSAHEVLRGDPVATLPLLLAAGIGYWQFSIAIRMAKQLMPRAFKRREP